MGFVRWRTSTHQVLVTNLDLETSAFCQLHRGRGHDETIFDEMKNQRRWGGFTTHDLARCRLAARLNALFYDWRSLFVRLNDHQSAAYDVGDGDAGASSDHAIVET